MSRRRGEFEHRTSIFEGAFRAWSHLGGLDPDDLEKKSTNDLDPLTNPTAPADDTRIKSNATMSIGRREYPYEALPRSGLSHPFVQAILSPWLGPHADQDAISLGLTTLRTWWQHRRKGESGSAVAALSTDKMQGVVDGYTRHFFMLAHCLVVKDKEQPPRSLHAKMKARDKQRRKTATGLSGDSLSESEKSRKVQDFPAMQFEPMDTELSPLERLHGAQQRQRNESSGSPHAAAPVINMKGKCIPGKIDLSGVVDSVNRHAVQLAHRGTEGPIGSDGQLSSALLYGDPDTMPIVFCSARGDCQIAMSVDGITCAHCVKIVETVLKGCNGTRSPIAGLLDAAADRAMNSVIIKIEQPADAKRVAFESARNLAMVGYTAKALEMSILNEDQKLFSLEAVHQAFQATASADGKNPFDWSIPCGCPDNGVQRNDCSRHAQMSPLVLDAFESRALEVAAYLKVNPVFVPKGDSTDPLFGNFNEQPVDMDQPMAGAQVAPDVGQSPATHLPSSVSVPSEKEGLLRQSISRASYSRRASRNPSILSFGNGLRQASMTSETTFGRAMSGLSALSIDWENLDDFDLEVDHSAHINNQARPAGADGPADNTKRALGV